MFKKPFFLGIFSLLLVGSIIFFNLMRVEEQDYSEFHSLAKRKTEQLTFSHLAQKREGVEKRFWIKKPGRTNSFLVKSRSSELYLKGNKRKWSITEHFDHLQGTSKEKNQQNHLENLISFQSEKGSYFYPEHYFLSNDTHFSMQNFSLFNTFKDFYFMTGTAQSFYFSPLKEEPNISLYGVDLLTKVPL